MATVPNAAQLNLGNNVLTNPDSTPEKGPDQELAFAANKVAQGQQKIVTDAALKISSDFAVAQNKINVRRDNINRKREFNGYFDEMSKEFQLLIDGDAADPARLEEFSTKLQSKTEETLMAHRGSVESKNRLAMQLEDQRAKFAQQSKTSVEAAQMAIVDDTFSKDMAQIISEVTTGKIDLATGLIKVDGLGEEYAEVASDTETFNKVETAQQMVILGSIQRLVDLGDTDKAEAIINSNPEVIQTLDPDALGKMIRSIELQKIQRARLVEEKQLEQDNILKAAGKTDPKELSPALRMLYYTGKMGKNPPGVKDNRTDEMKNADALTIIEEKHGKDSIAYKNLSQLIYKQKSEKDNRTPIQKQFDALDALEKGGHGDSQEARILRNQINEQDPVFVENKKKESDFPVAQQKMIDLEDETKMMQASIKEALILATGVDKGTGPRALEVAFNKALKEAKKGETAWLATGNPGLLMSIIAGTSDAASLEAVLSPIAANIVLRTMSDMRSQSSSGATGLGAMNNAEREMLRDAEGSLDPRKPLIMIRTLLKMNDMLPKLLKRQQDKFSKGFASILGEEPEPPDSGQVEKPNEPRGGQTPPGTINLMTYGDGENELPKVPATPAPAKTSTSTQTTTPTKTSTSTQTTTKPVKGKKNIVPDIKISDELKKEAKEGTNYSVNTKNMSLDEVNQRLALLDQADKGYRGTPDSISGTIVYKERLLARKKKLGTKKSKK